MGTQTEYAFLKGKMTNNYKRKRVRIFSHQEKGNGNHTEIPYAAVRTAARKQQQMLVREGRSGEWGVFEYC